MWIKMDPPDENAGDEPPPNIWTKKELTGGQIKQIPLTSLHRMKQDKMDAVIVPHTNAITKPHLHDDHKLARVHYSASLKVGSKCEKIRQLL